MFKTFVYTMFKSISTIFLPNYKAQVMSEIVNRNNKTGRIKLLNSLTSLKKKGKETLLNKNT